MLSLTTLRRTSLIVVGVFLILIASYLVYPEWVINVLQKRTPNVLYTVQTEQPVVALTLDDGPDWVTTPRILDVLNQNQAHATFFLISGHIPGNETVVERIVTEGHEIGNHLTIDFPSIRFPLHEFEKHFLDADRALANFAEPCWFRPGSGWFNQQMLSIVDKHDYRVALGSVYPFDPQIPSSWFSTQFILGNVRPGSVIILHDGDRRGERTVKTLSLVLPELKQRGFRVVTLSELSNVSAVEQHGLPPLTVENIAVAQKYDRLPHSFTSHR